MLSRYFKSLICEKNKIFVALMDIKNNQLLFSYVHMVHLHGYKQNNICRSNAGLQEIKIKLNYFVRRSFWIKKHDTLLSNKIADLSF